MPKGRAAPGVLSEADSLLDEVLRRVPDPQSPDVTLHVFQAIERDPDLLKRYKALLRQYPSLNTRIGWYVKRALGRENDGVRPVSPNESSLVKHYTRFKP